ncbi:hypothetical protein J437_LFUL010495 [Ladona fulva]|uniref:Uncharacterized protein n=1 Tax=Ladona fulva TaxID=123851 RepID=A0A8K0NY61_LADFU|nr:hypothetical protein J437_LFUL010495 [Ladona fulva]
MENLRKKRCRLLSSLAFLQRCRDSDILPSFVQINHHIKCSGARRILRRASMALFRERIRYTRWSLSQCTEEIIRLHLELSSVMASSDWNTLDRITYNSSTSCFDSVRETQTKKFEGLRKRQKPEIHMEHQRTVVNLSDRSISEAANSILAKGLNFAIAPDRIPTEEMIVSVEAAIRNLPRQTAEEIRIEVSQILRKAKPPTPNTTGAERRALRELRTDQDLVILPADMGNATIVINKVDYNRKMKSLLSESTYKEYHYTRDFHYLKRVAKCIGCSRNSEEREDMAV